MLLSKEVNPVIWIIQYSAPPALIPYCKKFGNKKRMQA